jgi:hypothetical protein
MPGYQMPACVCPQYTCSLHAQAVFSDDFCDRLPGGSLPLMALSVLLQSPPKWIVFRFVALNRVAKRIRHLAPTLQHLSSENSARDPGNQDVDQILDEFWVFKVEDAVFKVITSLSSALKLNRHFRSMHRFCGWKYHRPTGHGCLCMTAFRPALSSCRRPQKIFAISFGTSKPCE